MRRLDRFGRRVDLATVLSLTVGGLAALLWFAASRTSVYEPILELPLLAAVTFVLGAGSLYATFRTGTIATGRIRELDPTATWPSTVTLAGLACVGLLLLASVVLLANGAVYFALDRAWPISPSRAGSVHFYVLAATLSVPIVTAVCSVVGLAATRVLRRGS